MKKNKTIIIAAILTMTISITACGNNTDKAPINDSAVVQDSDIIEEDSSQSDDSEAIIDPGTDVNDDVGIIDRTSNQDGKLIERLKENFWWAEVEWPKSPLWDEHEGESCIQVCDMFFTDHMTYEEIYNTVMNSKLKDDILVNGIQVCSRPGGKFIKEVPKTFEEWRTCSDERPIGSIVFNLSRENYSVINLGTDDDPKMVYLGTHPYYIETSCRSAGPSASNDFQMPYTTRNDLDVEDSLDPEDKDFNPFMNAIIKTVFDMETEPMNIEEFFSDYDSLPEGLKKEKTID